MNPKYISLLLALLVGLGACGVKTGPGETVEEQQPVIEQPAEVPEEVPEETTPEPVPAEPNKTVTLTAVGDNLIHNTLSFDSKQPDGSYDFSHIYRNMGQYIEKADLAIYTQEVPLDGTVGSYPTLSAPQAVADAMAALGFDAASLANNHMADKGAAGALATMEALDARGIAYFGARAGQEKNYLVFERNGVKIGLLAYTYGLNMGLGDSSVTVDRIKSETIAADVAAIDPLCDVIVAAVHWGEEYQPKPSAGQQEMARKMADLGIDIIIGSHPHVLQPAEWLPREGKPDTFCIYSLGNFVSNQREQDRMLGGLLDLTLEFDPEGKYLGVQAAGIEGVVTHFAYKYQDFVIYPLTDYTEELEGTHALHQYKLPYSLAFLQQRMAAIQESVKR